MSIAGDIAAEIAEEPLRAKIADLEKQRDQLRAVCAEAYQLAGALGAPVEALDNLSAAANGDPLPHATFLPVAVPDVVAQRDQLLAALEKIKADLKIDDPLSHYDFVCDAIASVKGGAA